MCRTGISEIEWGGSAEKLIQYFLSTLQINVSENFVRHTTEFHVVMSALETLYSFPLKGKIFLEK